VFLENFGQAAGRGRPEYMLVWELANGSKRNPGWSFLPPFLVRLFIRMRRRTETQLTGELFVVLKKYQEIQVIHSPIA